MIYATNLVKTTTIDYSLACVKENLRIEDALRKAELVFCGVETSSDEEKFNKLSTIMQKVRCFLSVYEIWELHRVNYGV